MRLEDVEKLCKEVFGDKISFVSEEKTLMKLFSAWATKNNIPVDNDGMFKSFCAGATVFDFTRESNDRFDKYIEYVKNKNYKTNVTFSKDDLFYIYLKNPRVQKSDKNLIVATGKTFNLALEDVKNEIRNFGWK